MKIILLTLLCLLFAFTTFAQQEDIDKTPLAQIVGVEDVYLAKDNGEGKAGDAAEYFLTTDIPIYCVVALSSLKPAVVKMNLVAVNVLGVKAESHVITVSYKTNGNQNIVSFTGKPDGTWIAGSYRVDIFLDGKLTTGKTFEIKKSTSEIQPKNAVVEGFIPPKPRVKPRIVKQTRKN